MLTQVSSVNSVPNVAPPQMDPKVEAIIEQMQSNVQKTESEVNLGQKKIYDCQQQISYDQYKINSGTVDPAPYQKDIDFLKDFIARGQQTIEGLSNTINNDLEIVSFAQSNPDNYPAVLQFAEQHGYTPPGNI